MENIINSKENKLIKSAKKLFNDKKYRDATNLFICETYKVIEQLITNKIQYRNILISTTSKYLNKYKNQENVIIISNQIYEYLSDLKNADGLIAIFNKPKFDYEIKENGNYLILDKIQNPINLASITRTAICFNIDGIIITNTSVDIFNPTLIRTSMGSIFSLPIKHMWDLKEMINIFKSKKYKIFATEINEKAIKLNDVKFNTTNNVIIFGNEGNGLEKNDIKLCDETIYIPINKKIDSLNIGVSVGIILWELINKKL